MSNFGVIEHGESRVGRFVRHNRYAVALGIAAAEGVLVLAHAIPGSVVLVLAAVAVVVYFAWGRGHHNPDVRELTWVAALSQVVVAVLPVLFFIVTALAVIALCVLAIVVLAVLLLDRR